MALRVVTDWTGLQGAPYLTVHHFNGEGQEDADVAAAAVSTFWDAVKAGFVNDLTAARRGEVEEFDEVTGEITALWSTDPVNIVGTSSAEVLPRVTQLLVRWRTGVFIDGREVRGRTFVPGISQDGLEDGKVHSSFVTLFGTAASVLADAPLAIWRRPVYVDDVRTRDGDIVPVASSSVWNEFAELRSRRD